MFQTCLYDSGTSMGNSEILSQSSSSQGAIPELTEQTEDNNESNDLGKHTNYL